MINPTIITSTNGLYTRVGWRQPTQSGFNILTGDNLTTASGLYFQDFHPMLTIENIYDSQPDRDISDANFNTLLLNYQKSAILKVVNAATSQLKDLIDDTPLYQYPNVKSVTIDNGGKFVGYEINLSKCNDIAVRIESILLEFDGVKTFTIYLFQADRKSAIDSESVTTLENDVKITDLKWDLYNKSTSYNNGRFYIGYFQDDLGSVKAIDRDWEESNIKTPYNYFNIQSMTVEPNGTDLFDIDDVEYESETYGLNFNIQHHQYQTNLCR